MTGDLTPSPVAVTLTSGPAGPGSIDDFELFYARRALHRFRARLGRQGLLDLLAADIEEGNAFLRESARASDGTFQGGTTVLTARGLSSAEFLGWMDKAFAADENALLDAHPEHYVMAPEADGSFHVVENIGPHVCSFFMGAGERTRWRGRPTRTNCSRSRSSRTRCPRTSFSPTARSSDGR
ncbi:MULTISPECIES: hypothetical protein [Streptomyces]|uniref:hypothetical protein n=1 Tax=Streptomyces TaxID=1883 RepID=UPI001F0FC05B|nr:hypothetical protein [Streptomyces sp. S501]MDF9873015.1 hypothetical protein [Streptomyces pratensis]